MSKTLLIDTHILVWLFQDRERIGKGTKALLDDANQPVIVSYFSLMEMVFKAGAGKLRYDDAIFDDLTMLHIDVLMPCHQDLKSYRIFSSTNKDPFDNLLIATAIEGGYEFVTADRKILATKALGLQLRDARI